MTGRKGKTPKEPQPVATDAELKKLWESCYADRRRLTGKLSQVRASIRAGRKRPDDFVKQVAEFLNPLAERIGDLKWETDGSYRRRINLLSQNQKVRSAEEDRIEAEREAGEEQERQRKAAQAAFDANYDNWWTSINELSKAGSLNRGLFTYQQPKSLKLFEFMDYMIRQTIKAGRPIDDPIGFLDEMLDYLAMHYEPNKEPPPDFFHPG